MGLRKLGVGNAPWGGSAAKRYKVARGMGAPDARGVGDNGRSSSGWGWGLQLRVAVRVERISGDLRNQNIKSRTALGKVSKV